MFFIKLFIYQQKGSLALSVGSIEYFDCISIVGKEPLNECPGYDIKQFDGVCGSHNAGALRNIEYFFIAIAPRSTLTQSGSI